MFNPSGRHNSNNSNNRDSNFVYQLALICLLLSIVPAPSCADWLMDCGNCHCKWNSGKKTADCKNLSLSAVPENLSSEVQVLDLSHNRIPYLEQNAFLSAHLQNLHKLFIRNSTLQQINPRSFTQLEILIELDLSNNQLRVLQPNVFVRLIKVRALVLNGNQLEALAGGVFHNLKYLHKIELKHNRLKRIDAQAFVGVPLLSQIYLDGNQLSLLRKESFESLKRLTALSLDGNPWNCTCELQLFRDFVLKQNLYTPPTACFYPLQLRSMLWIEDQPEAFACKPKIIFPARGASINTSKENVTLVCRVHASANTVIAWDYNKQVYRSTASSASSSSLLGHAENQRVHIQLLRDEQAKEQEFGRDLFISRLTILGAEKSDEGIYTCLAENAGGKDAVQMSLLVQNRSGGPRDLLLHSNLFIVICLMALGLLSVSVLLSMVTCCIYKRFKHLNPSHHHHHEHMRQLELAGASERTNVGNATIAGGTEVLLDSLSAAENTSLGHYKQQQQQKPPRSGEATEAGSRSGKYVDVIKCGMGAHNNVVVGYLDNQATVAPHHHQLDREDRERGLRHHGDAQYLEQKSEDKLNAKPTHAELSRSRSSSSPSPSPSPSQSQSHSDAGLGRGRGSSMEERGLGPDLLPAYRSKGSHGHGHARSEQHSPLRPVNTMTGQAMTGRSKYNINVQEYLQSKYGATNNNNKHNAINGNEGPALAQNKREAPSIPSLLATSLSLVATPATAMDNPYGERATRHSKSLALPPGPQMGRSPPTDSYEYRQPPPPPYSAAVSSRTQPEQRRLGAADGDSGEPVATIVTASPSLSVLTTTERARQLL